MRSTIYTSLAILLLLLTLGLVACGGGSDAASDEAAVSSSETGDAASQDAGEPGEFTDGFESGDTEKWVAGETSEDGEDEEAAADGDAKSKGGD